MTKILDFKLLFKNEKLRYGFLFVTFIILNYSKFDISFEFLCICLKKFQTMAKFYNKKKNREINETDESGGILMISYQKF